MPIVCDTSAAGLGALGVVIVCAQFVMDIPIKMMAMERRTVEAIFIIKGF